MIALLRYATLAFAGSIGFVVLMACALDPMTRQTFVEGGFYGRLIVAWAACSAAGLALSLATPRRPRAEALGPVGERRI